MLTHTPSAAAALPADGLESVTLLIGGETCPAEVVDQWAPGRLMINAYGPTETTIYVAMSGALTAGSGVPPSAPPSPGRPCSSSIRGCGRCRPGSSASCMLPAAVSGSGMWAGPG